MLEGLPLETVYFYALVGSAVLAFLLIIFATVITPIPVRGMGEIQLKSVTGSLSRPAAFYVPQEVAAPRGSEVLIIELKERVCYVIPYEGSLKI